jgi:hypothetical protein
VKRNVTTVRAAEKISTLRENPTNLTLPNKHQLTSKSNFLIDTITAEHTTSTRQISTSTPQFQLLVAVNSQVHRSTLPNVNTAPVSNRVTVKTFLSAAQL